MLEYTRNFETSEVYHSCRGSGVAFGDVPLSDVPE